MLCHCHSCRRLTGSTFATFVVVPEPAIHLTSSENMGVVRKGHESGAPLEVHFCSGCGSAIYKTADRDGSRGVAMVYAGTLDKEILGDGMEIAAPDMELWVGLRAKWVAEVKGTKQWEGFPEPKKA